MLLPDENSKLFIRDALQILRSRHVLEMLARIDLRDLIIRLVDRNELIPGLRVDLTLKPINGIYPPIIDFEKSTVLLRVIEGETSREEELLVRIPMKELDRICPPPDTRPVNDNVPPALDRRKGTRGRKPGSGYHDADRKLVDRMQELIASNPSLSPHAAAMELAADAQGGGTPESKAKRLLKRFSEIQRYSGE
ncbi:hypothetical protein [Azospirillum aestuarii]|uniref:hypothetical protein n=1 Tax=Azospirillum aestuarii TaxID=2802052 RepID=UPI004054E3AC